MGTTPNYTLRYPELTTDPDIPRDIQFLAEDTDSALNTLQTTVDQNSANVTNVTVSTSAPTVSGSEKQGDIHCVLPA